MSHYTRRRPWVLSSFPESYSEDTEACRQFADEWIKLKRGYTAHTEQCFQLDVASIQQQYIDFLEIFMEYRKDIQTMHRRR